MENNKTAMLVMDMQPAMLSRLSKQGKEVVASAASAINKARKNDILIIFVRLGYRPGMPEISEKNSIFSSLKNNMNDNSLSAFMEIHPDLGITKSDIIVDKKRVSAFSGNDLDMILRAKNISHLVLCGIATSGIVLSTYCDAFDRDYQLTVLSDSCADIDDEMHKHLTEKLFPKHAQVVSVENWVL